MKDLLTSISECENINILDISDNLVKDEHVNLMSTMIGRLKGLKILKLDDCNIGE